jgi:hypothetical protein
MVAGNVGAPTSKAPAVDAVERARALSEQAPNTVPPASNLSIAMLSLRSAPGFA